MNCTEAIIRAMLAEPLGTNVKLSADSPAWHAEAFMQGIEMCFRHRPRVRIQALYFNGLKQFDYRPTPSHREYPKEVTLGQAITLWLEYFVETKVFKTKKGKEKNVRTDNRRTEAI
jgi:hypothetical protein